MSIEPKVVLIKRKEEADKILNNGTSSLIFDADYQANVSRVNKSAYQPPSSIRARVGSDLDSF